MVLDFLTGYLGLAGASLITGGVAGAIKSVLGYKGFLKSKSLRKKGAFNIKMFAIQFFYNFFQFWEPFI